MALFTAEFEILRRQADGGKWKEGVVRPDASIAANIDIGHEAGIGANIYIVFNNAVGANFASIS